LKKINIHLTVYERREGNQRSAAEKQADGRRTGSIPFLESLLRPWFMKESSKRKPKTETNFSGDSGEGKVDPT